MWKYDTYVAWLLSRLVIKTPSIALVNILAERADEASGLPRRRIVPEIIPWHGPSKPVADLAIDFLGDVQKRRDQRQNLLKLVAMLEGRGASRNVAEMALAMITKNTEGTKTTK